MNDYRHVETVAVSHGPPSSQRLRMWDLLVSFPSGGRQSGGLEWLSAKSCHWWQSWGVARGLFTLFPVLLGSSFPGTKKVLMRTAPQGRVLLCVGREGGRSLWQPGPWDFSHQGCFTVRATGCCEYPIRLLILDMLTWEVQDPAYVSGCSVNPLRAEKKRVMTSFPLKSKENSCWPSNYRSGISLFCPCNQAFHLFFHKKHQLPQKILSPLLAAGVMQDSLKKVNIGCGHAWQWQLSCGASRLSAR